MKITPAFAGSLMLLGAALFAAGCGQKTTDSSPVLATVNGENITQAQLDYARSAIAARPGASAPDNATILQGLVEQRLASQKAEKDKLDRNPGVLQALEAARRDALARVYVDQLVAKLPKPTADEVRQYYDGHPQNFAQRAIYMLQKVDAQVPRDQAQALAAGAQAATSAPDVVALLKAKAKAINVSQTPQPAESLGALLARIAALKVGQTIVFPQPQGLVAVTLTGVQPAPVAFEQARASIGQLLEAQKKREALQDQVKALRAGAKIEYLGKFAAPASAPAAAGAASGTPSAMDAASSPAPEIASAPMGLPPADDASAPAH